MKSGKYEEPFFMSHGSRRLIKQMLQVDPKKRITVNELLSHPWLTMNVLESVRIHQQNIKKKDEECILVLSQYYSVSVEDMWRHLRKWRYDYDTATYLLLQVRKKRNSSLKLLSGALKVPLPIEQVINLDLYDIFLNSLFSLPKSFSLILFSSIEALIFTKFNFLCAPQSFK